MVAAYTFLLQTAQRDPQATTRIILALICVIILSSTAVVINVWLARRMRRIAEEHPGSALANEEEANSSDHIDCK